MNPDKLSPPRKFYGFDLDEVYEQVEAAERQRKADAERAARTPKLPSPEPLVSPAPAPGVPPSHHGFVFESRAPSQIYAGTAMGKWACFFNGSLERIREAGYERHPRPSEAFGLIIDGLEDKLTGAKLEVYEDMYFDAGKGEWLSLALERGGDVLIAYVDPENLQWDQRIKSYRINGTDVRCVEQKEFRLQGPQPFTYEQQLILPKEMTEDLTIFLYGKSYDQLPYEVQDGFLQIPEQDFTPRIVHPVRFILPGIISVHGVHGVRGAAASRGVRRIKNVSATKGGTIP